MDELLKALPNLIGSAGVAGAVLAFLLAKVQPAWEAFKTVFWAEQTRRDEMRSRENAEFRADIRALEAAFDRRVKVDILKLIASPEASVGVKDAAEAIRADVETAQLRLTQKSE